MAATPSAVPASAAPRAAAARGEAWYNRRALRELPGALLGGGAWSELAEQLCSLPWLRAKLCGLGVGALLELPLPLPLPLTLT